MNFAESEEYLYSLGNEVEAMKLGLDNIRKLLAAIGNPEKKYLKVQIAGTNGKGSVCAFLNSICIEAGIKTGLYTSPHLVSVTERVKIDGVEISEEDFARLATDVRKRSEQLVAGGTIEKVATFFEQVTAIALLAFAESKVDLAILETGLGGRFDAVTAANAEICAITRIDLDHQQYLGETIEEIAAEKAAIVQDHTKAVVIGDQQTEALEVILGRCNEVGATPLFTRQGMIPPVSLGLAGNHQVENAKIAVLLSEILKQYFVISDQNVVDGLENARHPGRLERIGDFLLDGAHNIGGANALAEYIDEFIDAPITLIFGAMRDKNVAEIAAVLWPRASKIILTQPQNSRAFEPEELFELVPENVNRSKIVITGSVKEALERARTEITGDHIILITGSLYLVGEARKLLI